MKKAIRIVLGVLVFAVFLSAIPALSDSPLDQAVPFGTTCSKDGQFIPVFDGIGSKNKTDLLLPGQLCALDFSKLESSYYWYHIVYLDDQGEARDGYLKENNLEQLTVSDLTALSKDPEYTDLIDQYMELAEDSPLFLGEAATGSESKETKGRHYVINTNTHKFHYPSCKSVKQMKDKNRKDYTGERQTIIDMGYVPCKNCNP